MKIFVSHSSSQKLFVKELKRRLPDHLQLWIDEREIILGDNILSTIKDAIEIDSDFLIYIIDNKSIESPWVKKEIEWASQKEIEINRTFILPIVIEHNAWESLSDSFKQRKYLKCDDFNELTLDMISTSIVNELFALLSINNRNNVKSDKKNSSSIELLKSVEEYSKNVSSTINKFAYKYRASNPLELSVLKDFLVSNNVIDEQDSSELDSIIFKLQSQNYLSGYFFDGEILYLKQERYYNKNSINNLQKQKIAKKAVSYIQSNFTIALDAGSTTLEVAKQICLGIKMKRWQGLRVVTNFIPAAFELLQTANELGLEDENSTLSVFIIGGRIRPNSLAVVRDTRLLNDNLITDFSVILGSFGNADIGFVGANGVFENKGFAVHNDYEVKNKNELLFFSKRKFVLVDSSKLQIHEEKLFASFEDNLEIITSAIDSKLDVITNFENLIKKTNSKLIIA
ncbi:MAG: TIR domain-containing protein [Ignavibacteriae bacterium]|nr:TIR domain-containing protein [Flavobacteriaceae bacterium]MCB0703518.1 TIR domain-containing protein [Ignavibacteriota bacterium]